MRVQIRLIKAQIAGNNKLLPKFATKEETDLGLKIIVYVLTEVPLTNRLIPQILISKHSPFL